MTKIMNMTLPSFKKTVFFLAPPIFILIPICNPSQESTCAFIVLLTAAYWLSDCLSLGVTAMLPVFLFSVTGILNLKQITRSFFFASLWMFFGVYMLAIAVQTTNLHTRIALKILLTIGTAPRRLLFGFMLTAHVLSMFIANVPVTAMLLPIAEGLLQKLKENIISSQSDKGVEKDELIMEGTQALMATELEQESLKSYNSTTDDVADLAMDSTETTQIQHDQEPEKELDSLSRAIILCIPYSSTIGGVCTLTGSVTNLVAASLIHSSFPGSQQISFVTWFCYCTPGAFLMLFLTYTWILWLYIGFKKPVKGKLYDEKKVHRLIQQQYEALGPVSWEQGWTLSLFLLTTILWFTRAPGFVNGWGSLFPPGYITDGTVALGTGLMLFLLPKHMPTYSICKGRRPENDDRKILTFKDFHDKFCWEVIFIAGGGLVLSKGAQESGLSEMMATQLEGLGTLPPWVIIIILSALASLLTECTTNLAITSLLIPVLTKLAFTARIHPYYLCFPTFLSTSLAFMLPVASPPNAIAYSTGFISMKDLLKTGWLMNIIGLLVINISINSYGRWYLDLNEFPSWATTNINATESTMI